MGAMDEGLYLTRMKRASLGDWRLGNPMIYEHRDDPWLYGPAGEVLQGRVVRWLGLPVADVDILFTFLLPALLTVIAYQLFLAMTASVPFSVLGTMTVALGQYVLSKDTPLLDARLVAVNWTLPLQFVRPISPQFYFVPLLVLLWSAYRLFGGGSRRWVWAAGLAGGVQLYTNFFLTSFVVTTLALLTIIALVERRFDVVRRFLAVAAIAGVIGLAHIYNLWLTVSHPVYQESFTRGGGYLTREAIIPIVHAVVAGMFIAGCWRARRERWYQFVTALLAAGFICLNQQLITGRTVQPFHWESQTNKLALEIALVMGAWYLARSASALRRPGAVFCAVGVAVLLAHGWALQDRYVEAKRAEFSEAQRLGPALRWLADNTSPSDVVLVNPLHFDWAEYVTTVSGNYTYISEPFFFASFITRGEVERRYLGGLRFFGATPEEASAFANWLDGAHFLGMQGMPSQVPTADRAFVARYVQDVLGRYHRDANQDPWKDVGDFKLDYVLLHRDDKARVIQRIAPADVHQVFDDSDFVIWRVPRRG